MIAPYEKRDFKSHCGPPDVYCGTNCMEVNSIKLCHIIAGLHHWDLNCSYRVPGKIHKGLKVAIFFLTKAEAIDRFNASQSE